MAPAPRARARPARHPLSSYLVKLVPGETNARLWRSVWSDTLLYGSPHETQRNYCTGCGTGCSTGCSTECSASRCGRGICRLGHAETGAEARHSRDARGVGHGGGAGPAPASGKRDSTYKKSISERRRRLVLERYYDERRPHAAGGGGAAQLEIYTRSRRKSSTSVRRAATRDPRPATRVCGAVRQPYRRGGNSHAHRPGPVRRSRGRDAPRAPGPRDVDRFAQSVSDPRHAAHTQPKPARPQCNAQRGSRNNTRTCKTYGMRANGIAKKTDHVALKRPSVTPSEGHSVRPRSGYRDYRP